jgi:hypothetical protein
LSSLKVQLGKVEHRSRLKIQFYCTRISETDKVQPG